MQDKQTVLQQSAPQCNGPFGDEEDCPIHGAEIRAARGKAVTQLVELRSLWMERAKRLRQDAAYTDCAVTLEACADELSSLRIAVAQDEVRRLREALADLLNNEPCYCHLSKQRCSRCQMAIDEAKAALAASPKVKEGGK